MDSFGYKQGHYEVSQACGERVLFPTLRGTAADDLVSGSGFICRTTRYLRSLRTCPAILESSVAREAPSAPLRCLAFISLLAHLRETYLLQISSHMKTGDGSTRGFGSRCRPMLTALNSLFNTSRPQLT